MATKRELTSTSLCIKYLLFAANFIYFAAGCAILGVCTWIMVERNFVSAMVGEDLMTVSSVLLIICGSVIILVSFFGCCGALMEQRCMLLTYFVLLLIMFLTMLVAGVLAIVFRSQFTINEEMRNEMRNILQNTYGVNLDDSHNRYVTQGWDNAQAYLYCCGVEDAQWSVYRASNWYKEQPGILGHDKPYVPESCCTRDQYNEFINKEMCQFNTAGPPSQQGGRNNPAIHYRGCFPAGKDFVMEYTGYILGLGFGVAIAMLVGMGFSLYLYQQLARSY